MLGVVRKPPVELIVGRDILAELLALLIVLVDELVDLTAREVAAVREAHLGLRGAMEPFGGLRIATVKRSSFHDRLDAHGQGGDADWEQFRQNRKMIIARPTGEDESLNNVGMSGSISMKRLT